MAEEPNPEATAAALRSADESRLTQRTSDQYRVSHDLPARFNHPGWFRGYRVKERNLLFRTTNMDYGAKPPTVHEMPTSFHVSPHSFSDRLITFGMYRNYGINTAMEKSYVTGPDNFITFLDTRNFHPSYRTKGPSLSEHFIVSLALMMFPFGNEMSARKPPSSESTEDTVRPDAESMFWEDVPFFGGLSRFLKSMKTV